MELDFLSLPVLLISVFLALTLYVYKSKAGGDKKLPPGSFGWPFIGETIEFLYGKPEKFVGDRMKKYSTDIFKTKIFGEPTAVICGPAGNKFLFSNEQKLVVTWRPHSLQEIFRHSKFSKPAPAPTPSPSPAPVSTGSKPGEADTKILRTPGFFKPEALVRYLGQMEEITQHHLQMYWEGRNELEVFPLSKIFTLTLACRYFLGVDDVERISKLVQHFDDTTVGIHSIILNIPGTTFYRAKKATGAIRRELQQIVKEKKAAMATGAAAQDILSHMISASDPTGRFMPEAEIADKIMGILIAGYSTVATTVTFLMKYIGERPHIYEKVLAEQMEIAKSKKHGEGLDWEDFSKMKYSWNVAYEVMRFTPPLQGTFREAITDFTYAGYTIPKGWKIYWTVSTTNNNPEYFPEPEKFDPSRYDEGNGPAPFSFVPFGGGPRTCIGKEYARLATLTFIHHVVKKFEWEVIFPNEKITGDMMPTPEKGLPIRLRRH